MNLDKYIKDKKKLYNEESDSESDSEDENEFLSENVMTSLLGEENVKTHFKNIYDPYKLQEMKDKYEVSKNDKALIKDKMHFYLFTDLLIETLSDTTLNDNDTRATETKLFEIKELLTKISEIQIFEPFLFRKLIALWK